jgi:cytochrome c oxidase cbb3-type subunit 4
VDIGLVRGLLTLVLFLAFVGIVVWAYSSRRAGDFDEAANLPLNDEHSKHAKERDGERHD